MPDNARNVLLTGASGFVGAALARALASRSDVRLRVLCRATSDRSNLAGLELEILQGDLRDADSLESCVAGCDAVFHAAADYRIWVPDPAAMQATNVDGTLALARAAKRAGVRRFVYTSSVATLGLPAGGGAGDEQTAVRFEDMVGTYKRSKFLAERALEHEAAASGLNVVYLHPSAPVGPGDIKPTPTGRMILDAATGRMPAYVDTGLNLVHVDDVAHGHLAAWERAPAGRHYVLAGENLTLREILERIARLMRRRAPRWRLNPGVLWPAALAAEAWAQLSGREPRLCRDALRMSRKLMFFRSLRAQRELGFEPRPTDEALWDALTWFATRGACERPAREQAPPDARAGRALR